MAQDLRDQLANNDPKVRAQAIKGMALSGNQDYLKYLIEIAENDPDPQVQDYARKAAQHLYTSQTKPQPKPEQKPDPEPIRQSPPEPEPIKQSPPEPEPISQPPLESEKTESEIDAALANPMFEDEEEDLSPANVREAESKVQRAFSLHASGQTKKALPIYAQALELNPDLGKNSFSRSVASELTGKPFQEAMLILGDPDKLSEFIETNYGKAKKVRQKASSPSPAKKRPQADRSKAGLIQTWLSFFGMTEDLFLAEQEKANTEDTLLSVLVYTIATVVISMVTGFFQFQQITTLMGEELPQLGFSLGTIFFIILIGTVIMSPIMFYMSVGLQFLGARIFGGSGDFKSHAYLMALILVPTTVLGGLVSLLALIPVIGFIAGLAGFGLSIYTIILTVRLVKVAHNLPTGKAVAGIIIPPIVLSAIGGCILMTIGSSLINMISQIQ